MSDLELRELDRRWDQSGDPADGAHLPPAPGDSLEDQRVNVAAMIQAVGKRIHPR